MKLPLMVSALLLIQTASASAISPEVVRNLQCSQVTQAGIARQSWSAGGAPFGAPLSEWNASAFDQLRYRISECASRAGQDPRGSLAYLQRLEGMTRLQNAQSAAAGERGQRRGTSPDVAAEHDARSSEDGQRSQTAYERFVQQRDQEVQAANSPDTNERSLVAKVETFASQDELKAFCNGVWRSQLPENARINVIANCKRRLQLMAIDDQKQAETRQMDASGELLPDLIQKLKQMPDNEDTLRQLQNLKSDNQYRLPSLSYPDQNKYLQAIDSHLAQISTKRLNDKCAVVTSKISVPNEIRDAIVIDGLDGVSLAYFLCGPVLTTDKVSVTLRHEDVVDVKVGLFTLTFARRRYLKDRKIEVAVNSPIQGGVNALILTGASNGTDELAIGNANFFVVNFYSQFSPQVDAYLPQPAQ